MTMALTLCVILVKREPVMATGPCWKGVSHEEQ